MGPIWTGFALIMAMVSKCSSQYSDSKPRGMVERTIIYAIGERPHPDDIYNTNQGRRDNKYHAHATGYVDHGGYTSFSQTYYGKSRGKELRSYQPSYRKDDRKTVIFVGDRESPKEIYYTNRGRSSFHGHGKTGGHGSGSGYSNYQQSSSYQSRPSYQSGPSYKRSGYDSAPKGYPQGRELYTVSPVDYQNQYGSKSYSAQHMPKCPKVDVHFCDYQQMGHYSHPAERQCYVQCDDYGKAYVRNCPYGTVWMRAPEQPHHMGFCG